MRKYIAPEYDNEKVMSNDIITESYLLANGVVQTNSDVIDPETKEVIGKKASFSYSVSNFFTNNN